jgi:hypothetical protein
MSTKPVIICLTPVRNEAWILDMFLQCTSLWADYILIADQGSTDGSKEIALKYPKVRIIENKSESYNEVSRQKLLLAEARKIPGKRMLIALDADEIFTSDFEETDDWKRLLNAKPGDVFGFRWINICSNFRKGWQSDHFGWAFMDDGSEHTGSFIHNPRIPISTPDSIIKFEQIKVLHYQYTNWGRMQSKHRYYQCLERISYPEKKPVNIYRMYHHMFNIKENQKKRLETNWFTGYERHGIKVREVNLEKSYWFDKEVLSFFDVYGLRKFKKEAIWDVNWNDIAKTFNFDNNEKYFDPRNSFDRLMHLWLNQTQRMKDSFIVRKIDNKLSKIW